jgi:hypothetical protein
MMFPFRGWGGGRLRLVVQRVVHGNHYRPPPGKEKDGIEQDTRYIV